MAWKRPWIKLWVEMLDDPKMLSLTESQRWVWCALLLATTRSPEPGRMLLPSGRPMTVRQLWQVSRCTEMSQEEFQEALELMEEQEMVAWREGVLEIVNWHRRQDPRDVTAPERMRRYRERQRQGNGRQEVTGVTAQVTGEQPSRITPPNTEVTPAVTPPVKPPVTGDVRGSGDPDSGTAEVHEGGFTSEERNSRNADRHGDRNDPRNVTGLLRPQEEERGRGVGGQAPHQKSRGAEENPSGANAPSGPAPASSLPSTAVAQIQSSFGENGAQSSAAASAAESPASSPGDDRGGGGTAPRPEINGEDSRRESAGGERAAPRAMSGRRKTGGNPQVDGVLEAIQELWGQPVVHWAKEAREVKAALARGYQPEQVLECWKAAQESPRWKGRWMPLAYLVEDLGEFVKNGGRPLRKWGAPPGKEDARAESRPTLPTAEDWRSRRGRW